MLITPVVDHIVIIIFVSEKKLNFLIKKIIKNLVSLMSIS